MANHHITAVSRADLSRTTLPARHRHAVKSVLKVFADYANESNRSWPHVATIALEAGCGKNAVSRATEECVRANLLRKRKTRNGNHYVLNMRLLKEIEVPRPKRRDPEFPEFDDTDLHESDESPEEPPPEPQTGDDQAFPHDGETVDDQAFPHDGETVSPRRGNRFPTTGNGFPHDGEQIPYPSPSDPPTNQGRADGWLETQENEKPEQAQALLDGLVMPHGAQYQPQQADVEHVQAALGAGIDPERIESEILSGLEGAERPAAVVGARCRGLRKVAESSTAHSGSQGSMSLPEWCGQCDGEHPAERFVERDDRQVRCECHPNHPSRRPSAPAGPSAAEQADPHGVLAQAGIAG